MARSDKYRYFSQKKEYDDSHKIKVPLESEQPIQVSGSLITVNTSIYLLIIDLAG